MWREIGGAGGDRAWRIVHGERQVGSVAEEEFCGFAGFAGFPPAHFPRATPPRQGGKKRRQTAQTTPANPHTRCGCDDHRGMCIFIPSRRWLRPRRLCPAHLCSTILAMTEQTTPRCLSLWLCAR